MSLGPLRRLAGPIVVLATAAALWTVAFRVDFTPRVEADFFFSTDDPELQATTEIEARFPSSPQVLIAAAGDAGSPEYLEEMRRLSDELRAISGVASIQSLTHGPPSPAAVAESPVWRRLLLGESPGLTQVVVSLDDEAAADRAVVLAIEEVAGRFDQPAFDLEVSGVPYVLELIRRHLLRDLRVFTVAAFLVFGLLVTLVYRSLRIVLGTLASCLAAGALTLAVLDLLGTPIGLLTANIVTIVFVLTLSHIVFLTANWRVEHQRNGGLKGEVVERALGITLGASFWCMVTTFLGFSSLLFASAKPLRELGTSGAIGTVAAIVVAYGLYPLFLAHATPPRPVTRTASLRLPPRRVLTLGVLGVVAATVVAAFGLPRLDTDPSLLDYFATDDEIRHGIELVDRSGGSSPLYLVVTDGGERVDSKAAQEKMAKLLASLEDEPGVGVALALPALLDEARRIPLARFLPSDKLLDFLMASAYGGVVRTFVAEDRLSALYFLRMREAGRGEPRRQVVERLRGLVAEAGLECEAVGGLYDLQGKLGELVAGSLLWGLSALLVLFLVIAFVVAHGPRVTAAMVLSLAAVPVLMLGLLGHLGVPLDVISSPAANVAIALGIDSMIHLVMAARRRIAAGDDEVTAWREASNRLWPAVVGATLILAMGFGIFGLSSFPPTRRFGLTVALGTAIAAVMALVVMPYLATLGRRLVARRSEEDEPDRGDDGG